MPLRYSLQSPVACFSNVPKLFWWHKSLCIFNKNTFQALKLGSYFAFPYIWNLKEQLFTASRSLFQELLFGPGKLLGLSPWPLFYEMRNSKVKVTWAHAEDHVIFNSVMHWSRAARGQQLPNIVSRSGYISIWSGAGDQESTNHNPLFPQWKSSYIALIVDDC